MRGPLGCRNVLQVALEVADHAVDPEPGILRGQRLGALAHHALGDVHRHVALERAGRAESVQQHPRLGRRARAELHQLHRARQLRQLLRAFAEDRALAARGVVLRQLADLVEQPRAAGVVEVLGGQLLERAREAVQHVLGQRAFLGAVEVRVDLDGGRRGCGRGWQGLHRSSRARRNPAKIWRRFGQVPVAEADARHTRVRRPRAPAQHAVTLAEEHLGVLAVGVRLEARVAVEVRSGPLPHLPRLGQPPAGLLGPGRRPLPLCLGG